MVGKSGSESAPRPVSPVLVLGLANAPSRNQFWVWDLLDRVAPQLVELIRESGMRYPLPDFRKATLRRHRLTEALPERERVVLVTAAEPGERHAEITHWHCGSGPLPILSCRGSGEGRPPALHPAWLEEDLPETGLDLIRLPAAPMPVGSSAWVPRGAAAEAGRPGDGRFLATGSALLGLLWSIVREVGVTRETARSAREVPRAA